MKKLNLITTIIVLIVISILRCTKATDNLAIRSSTTASEESLPKGYYAFNKAALNARPPKVRKPPYLSISAECPGVHDSNMLMPKNNMCGDLNRGFIPRNPMGQYLFGQPYPFEIIKNKTLQFLSKTLPYLKDEIDNVPKVTRFVRPSDFFENYSRRNARQVNRSELNDENAPFNSTSATSVSLDLNSNGTSTKQNRQNGCEGNVICQAIESLKEEGPFSKSFLSNVVSAVGNVASINNVVSLLDQYSQSSNNSHQHQFGANPSGLSGSNLNNGNRFALSQLLSSISGDSGTSTGNGISSTGTSSNGNSYSPLLSIIDYLQSLQTPKFATKRKTSPDVEDLIPDSSEKPQTPCMSTEEYISPTYARNYQGVWKYVVQIPNEGYFTQTIQQTTCLKNKCDLLEGSCRESPRWVSLLVAEIFYPDIYFPVNQLMPMLYKQQMIQQQQQQQQQQLQQQQQQHLNQNQAQQQPTIVYKPNLKRPFPVPIVSNQLNGFDFSLLNNLMANRRHEAMNLQHLSNLKNMELLARKARSELMNNGNENDASTATNVNEDDNVDVNNSISGNNNNNNINNNKADTEKKHCDGYDKIGCYVVRVYYDWFLVNGSCKCWKSSTGGSTINETIKRIFIGKWKRK